MEIDEPIWIGNSSLLSQLQKIRTWGQQMLARLLLVIPRTVDFALLKFNRLLDRFLTLLSFDWDWPIWYRTAFQSGILKPTWSEIGKRNRNQNEIYSSWRRIFLEKQKTNFSGDEAYFWISSSTCDKTFSAGHFLADLEANSVQRHISESSLAEHEFRVETSTSLRSRRSAWPGAYN